MRLLIIFFEGKCLSMTARKKFIGKYLPAALIISFIAAVFIFLSLFFHTHFYPGTVINGIDISFQTAEAADKKLADRTAAYFLVLKERGNVTERIYGYEIGLKPDKRYGGAALKKEQNRIFWLISLFSRDSLRPGNAFTCDEDLLKMRFDELSCTDESRVIEPVNASLVYSNGAYNIVKEVYGNKVNETLLYYGIRYAVSNGKPDLDLEQLKCYVDPTVKADSRKLNDTKATVERYIASRITYVGGSGGGIHVDADKIGEWIGFEKDLDVTFDTEKIRGFLKDLATCYDTVGKVRKFVTTSGRTIEIGGGDYGWKVDIKKETEELLKDIMRGSAVSKEPRYSQKGVLPGLNDIGSTYVEIDLTNQHLWFYADGELKTGGATVTGNVAGGYRTPEGIYSLKYKVRNAVLKGPNYRASVSYWMPFYGDIGIHDASWRTDFGRDIYLARGSHGCINVQLYLAKALYNDISVGTPIICYY